MSLALIREHADVKEEFDRLSKIRHEQFISSVANMIAEIKSFAASYMKENDFLVTDHPEGKTITGTYKDVKISLKYPEVEERSPDAHSVFEVSHNHKSLTVGASLTTAGESVSGGFISYSSKEDRLRVESGSGLELTRLDVGVNFALPDGVSVTRALVELAHEMVDKGMNTSTYG